MSGNPELRIHLSNLVSIAFGSALLLAGCNIEPVPSAQFNSQLFKQISTDESGINFINQIQHDVSTKYNLFDYDYFYSGAGVGVGDINNDGLPDIFFAANQQPNKLYLNQGDLKFKDITTTSGINVPAKQWSNGVAMADVNLDGWLDIYISQGGPGVAEQRRNLLFINQGDLTFKEVATDVGLNDIGISTQSAFFDYDKDGDLDCFVMNESEYYGYDPVTFHRFDLENPAAVRRSYSHLYRNDNGKFLNVSRDAGIDKPTFGLGLVISDINADGWLDIYVANDYYLPEQLYINRKDGTFSDRAKSYFSQMPHFGMGVDIADIDNDGHQDIYVLDMASKDHFRSKTLMASMDLESFSLLVDGLQFPHQYMFNALQLSSGQGRFHNVSHMTGLAKTDWSWAALIADLDLDGLKDIFVSNGFRRYSLDNDFKISVTKAKTKYAGNVPLDVKARLYEMMPSDPLPNNVFRNMGDLKFEEQNTVWGLDKPTFSNGAVLSDLDNDGDLDMVINNIDQQALLYRNTTADHGQANFLKVLISDHTESFAKITIEHNGQTQFIETKRIRGYRSSLDPVAVFGLGNDLVVDKIRVEFLNGNVVERESVKANQTLTIKSSKARKASTYNATQPRKFHPAAPVALGLAWQHVENPFNDFEKEVLLPQKQSTLGPHITTGDANGDGLQDLYVSGANGQPGALYVQTNGKFEAQNIPAFVADQNHEDGDALFIDIDDDGDLDLFVISAGNEYPEGHAYYADRLYLNDGQGHFSKSTQPLLDQMRFSGGALAAVDIDKDGKPEVVVGNRIRPQSYPMAGRNYILKFSAGRLDDVTEEISPEFASFGIVNDLEVTDFNNDGWEDLIAVGEWGPIGIFKNDHGKLSDISENLGLDKMSGWWYSVHELDINADGHKDYIVGNVGMNIKHKASAESPFKVFAHDFDGSGSLDIVLSSEYKGDYVPSRGRECSSQQMPFILDSFTTYNAFASATLGDVYGAAQLESAYQKSVTEFRSILLVNQGDGNGFDIEFLPITAQAFPLLDAVITDLNNDGYDDVILAGCIYNTEVETPRLDNGSGLVLLSNGVDNFNIAPVDQYGLYIEGNVKALTGLTLGGDRHFLLGGTNDGPLTMFEIR